MAWVVSAAVTAVSSFVAEAVAFGLLDAGLAVGSELAIGSMVGTVASLYALSEVSKAITGGAPQNNVGAQRAQGILINSTSNVDGLPVIYGTRRVGGSRVLCEVSGASNEYLHLVIALGEGEIDSVANVYIGDVLSTDARFAGLVTTEVYTGTDTQSASAALMAALGSKWTSAFQGKGVAYLYLRCQYSPSAFNGLPVITADVTGRKVYDPRTGLTVYSNNPALCIRDYLTNTRYGKGLSATVLDDNAIIAAANYCDTQVTVPGGTQKRYTCDGVVDVNNTAYDNIRSLLTSCRGLLVYSGGVYKLLVDQVFTGTPFAFTEDNIVGNWSIMQPGRRAKFNRVTGGFFNPAASWQPDYGISDSPAFRGQDNGLLLEAKIDLPFTADMYRAQQLAGLHLKQSRFGLTVRFAAMQGALRCEVGDVVSITHSTPGWSAKLFRVTQLTLRDDDEVEVVAAEYDATVYNLDTLTAITGAATSKLPDVFAVPTPASLTLTSGGTELLLNTDGTVISRIKCAWPAPADVFSSVAELQGKLSTDAVWQSFALTDAMQGIAWLAPVKDGAVYNVRIRFRNGLGVQSAWCTAAAHTVVGKTAAPSDVGSITAVQEQFGTRLTWPDVPDVDLYSYELRVGGANWAAATALASVATPQYLWKPQATGTIAVRVKAIDTTGNYSANDSVLSVVVSGPGVPSITYALEGVNEVIGWGIPASNLLIDRYELRYGASWAAGTFVDTTKATGYRRKADYAGGRTYWVAAIDAAGNVGAAGSVAVNIAAPGAVSGVRTDVVDNNVLLYWAAPSAGTLPVVSYEVRKGSSWAAGVVVGSNGNSTFAAVFEQQSGTYTYWVAAIDSVGNYGTPAGTSAFVNQPPDYIFRANINSAFGGTLANAMLAGGALLLPVNTTETWSQHFANNGYATPQAQITAGYPIYINPSPTSASYTEVVDYGSTLPATNVVVVLNSTVLSGAVGASCQISYSNTSATGPWTDGPAGATAVLATNFRWIKVVYTFTATAGANLLQANGLTIKLSVKQRTDSGAGTVTVAASGAAVVFGYAFSSADTPIVQPNGATPLIPVVVYAGGANPTGFTVYLYTLAGALTTGSFSWSVRGY
jgi:Putative phage tail protein